MTAAICLTAWPPHDRRGRSEATSAALAGAGPPIPASSGKAVRHRLNSGVDVHLNRALHIAVLTRMTHDPETRAYTERRGTRGCTTKEIRRCLKRGLARQICLILNAAEPAISPV